MRLYDWKAVQQYHDLGHSFAECARKFGFSHTAWTKAIQRGELVVRVLKRAPQVLKANDRRRVYDWSGVQQYYDAGHSFRDCQEKFGFATMAWHKARQRGEIVARPLGMPIDILLERPAAGTT